MSKPTYDELVEALRAMVDYGPHYLLDDEHVCYFCCENHDAESRLRNESLPIVHDEGCIYAKAEVLLARIDAQEGPTYSDLKFEGPTLEEFGRFTVAPMADDGEPECPPPDEPDYPGEASL